MREMIEVWTNFFRHFLAMAAVAVEAGAMQEE
jgi:hypothetical protein